MARSIERRAQARIRRQQGDALMEGVMAMLLSGVVGLGMVYSISKMAASQRQTVVVAHAVDSVRAVAQRDGMAAICSGTGVASLPGGVTQSCSVQSDALTISGKSQNVKVPKVTFQADGSAISSNMKMGNR